MVMISLEIRDDILKEIDTMLKEANCKDRTEFVREAVYAKVRDIRTTRLLAHAQERQSCTHPPDEEHRR